MEGCEKARSSWRDNARRRILDFVRGKGPIFSEDDVKAAAYSQDFYLKLGENIPGLRLEIVSLLYCQMQLDNQARADLKEQKLNNQLKGTTEQLHRQKHANGQLKLTLGAEIEELRRQNKALQGELCALPVYQAMHERIIRHIEEEVGKREVESSSLHSCSLMELHMLDRFPHQQRRLWVALGQYPDYSQRQFARHLGVSIARINQMLMGLEKAGLARKREGAKTKKFSQGRLADSVLRLPANGPGGFSP